MKPPRVSCIDFETEAIIEGSHLPPVPVGVSIQLPEERKARYYAWGHDSANNCSKDDARRALMAAWTRPEPKLFFNMKFDLKVAQYHMDVPDLAWDAAHDAMFLLFLLEPHSRDMRLKPSSERILGLPPEERDAVQDWLLEAGVVSKQGKAKWGGFISKAPGAVVAPYANGDVLRTLGLFWRLYPEIAERGMLPAYDRERRLLPVFMRNECEGIRVDVEALQRDIPIHEAQMSRAEGWLKKRLKAPELNIDSDAEMVDVLDREGIVTEWALTPTGKRSVSKKNLKPDMFHDTKVRDVLGYRNRMATCLRMFERSWLAEAENGDGRIHCLWNQVRQPKGASGDSGGTRTGRPSAESPNLLNLSRDWYDKGDGYVHPKVIKLEPLPLVRRYILPDRYGRTEGVFLHRDFSQQELRLLAHFEDGLLLQQYTENPWMDVHDFVGGLIADLTGQEEYRGKEKRRFVKTANFGRIYGRGVGSTAEALGCTVNEVKALLRAHGKALPGIEALNDVIKRLVRNGLPIRTWAGREYFVEEPLLINGRMVTWEYKLLNYLIQGSAADVTKEVLIRYDGARKESRFLTTVYDEINISAPPKAAKQEMKILRDCMESIELDLPLLTDGGVGPNWADLTDYAEPKFDIVNWNEQYALRSAA